MTLTFAVIGKTGQLAQALAYQVQQGGHKAIFYDRAACDLSQSPSSIEAFIREIPKPDALIIAAAYTNVDGAETEQSLAFAVNAQAPTAIAKACAERNIPLVHISTDCVFDGTSEVPYTPEDATNPANVYGASKLAGEQAVLASGAQAVILRTSWVYGATARNFLALMLNLAQTHHEIRVVESHIGCPTNVLHLADAVIKSAQNMVLNDDKHHDVYHVCGSSGPVSRVEFARAIFDQSSAYLPHNVRVIPVGAQEFASAAVRPAYCALSTTAFERDFDCILPAWDDGLELTCGNWFQRHTA